MSCFVCEGKGFDRELAKYQLVGGHWIGAASDNGLITDQIDQCLSSARQCQKETSESEKVDC